MGNNISVAERKKWVRKYRTLARFVAFFYLLSFPIVLIGCIFVRFIMHGLVGVTDELYDSFSAFMDGFWVCFGKS